MARTVTGEDENWKTTTRLRWEQSDEAKRIAAEAAETKRVEDLLALHLDAVREIFTAFDLDGNGVIDLEEMQTVIRKEICAPLKKSEIRDMYNELDTDGDGTIDFKEFHRWYVLNILDTGKLEGRKLTRAQLKVQRSINRMKGSLTTWVQEKMPEKRHPKVPGYDALIIRDGNSDEEYIEDLRRVKPKFWWWAREMYGLDKDLGPSIDEQRDFTPNEFEAFDLLFKPQWNSGKLPVKFYHDGRRFYKKGKFWRQRWDRKEGIFTWTDEATGFKTHLNPDPNIAEKAARMAAKSSSGAAGGTRALKTGIQGAGRAAVRGASMIGRGMIAGGAMVGRKVVTIGLHPDVATLVNLGFSRRIAKRAVERFPNPVGSNRRSPDAVAEQQLQEANTLQIEHDEYVRNRSERLKENPHLGMIIQKQAAILGRGIIDILRRRRRDNLTEEERKANQLAALRRDLYGDGGLPSEYIDLESSDDEDAFGNIRD